VAPKWCADKMSCWEQLVDMWDSPQWRKKHDIGKAKRAVIEGGTHHQGSVNLKGFAKRYVSVSSSQVLYA